MMRTTINLTEAALNAARAYARAQGVNLGQAVSELIIRGSTQKLAMKQEEGVWVFELPPDTPRVTARQVRELLNASE